MGIIERFKKNALVFFIIYGIAVVISEYIAYLQKTTLSLHLMLPVILLLSFFIFFIIKENIGAAIELKKAQKEYFNSRNRIDFFQDKQIVCIEGVVEAKEGVLPLKSPITNKDCVAYSYGNVDIVGGMEFIPTVIKPAGDKIDLVGMLSVQYCNFSQFKIQNYPNTYFKRFIDATEYQTAQQTQEQFSNKEDSLTFALNTPSKTEFKLHSMALNVTKENISNIIEDKIFDERYIANNMYAWVVGIWDKQINALVPLKYSNAIFIIEKDYKETFGEYLQKTISGYIGIAIFLSLFILMFTGFMIIFFINWMV